MILRYMSDLHLEFSGFTPIEAEADIVVLAGDIGMHTRGLEWAARTFLNTPVIYVAGNHELYDAEIDSMHHKLRERAKALGIHFLENDEITINSVRFLGATLWTDYALFGCAEKCMKAAQYSLNDHYAIRMPNGQLFQPEDALRRHHASRSFLHKALHETHAGKTVVVTHHAPSIQSSADRFKNDLVTAAFASNLEFLMDKCDVWIHGHTHNRVTYQVDKCQVACNPRGYITIAGKEQTGFEDPAILTLE